MTISVIYEDDVDWQPLIIRFVNERKLSASKANQIARFVRDWMDNAAEDDPDLWAMAKEWDCTVSENRDVIARCECLPESEIQRLSVELHDSYPTLKEMRLGYPLSNPTTVQEIDWYQVPNGSVQIGKTTYDVPAFKISFTPVTVGQFQAFLDATNYTPVPDKIEDMPGYLIDHFKINFGHSPKHVLFGVTHDDAIAFCGWAKLRLPTDAELKHFFHSACADDKKFQYSGECWTSTRSRNGKYVAWNGPYRKECLNDPDGSYRKLLPQHQYEFLEAPCFRVVRPE